MAFDTWYLPIDTTNIDDDEKKRLIESLNMALDDYARNKTNKKDDDLELLGNIIEKCEEFIKSIPASSRVIPTENSEQNIPYYPFLTKVIDIQKKATCVSLLPDADNNAAARWKVLKNIFNLHANVHTKTLDINYWQEARLGGRMMIAHWLNGSNYLNARNLLSLHEIIENEYNASGINRDDMIYLTDPSETKVDFLDGKLFQEGRPLQTLSIFSNDAPPGEMIFVLDEKNTLYAGQGNTVFHHSSFLEGKAVQCAGSIKVDNGELKRVTILSGHYKPTRIELLNFLEVLKTEYHVNLDNVLVNDVVSGADKNAAVYLKSQGKCLPDNPEKLISDLALKEYQRNNWGECENLIETAKQLGSEEAWLNYALVLIQDTPMYSSLSAEEKKDKAIQALMMLSTRLNDNGREARYQLSLLNINPPEFEINDKIPEQFGNAFKYLKEFKTILGQAINGSNIEGAQHKKDLKYLITKNKSINELYSMFKLLQIECQAAVPGSDAEKNAQKLLKSLIPLIQEKAFDLAIKDKIGLVAREQSQLEKIWSYKGNKSLFSSNNYQEKLNELINKGDVKPPVKVRR